MSLTSGGLDSRHHLLLAASAQAKEVRVREILAESPVWNTPPTSTPCARPSRKPAPAAACPSASSSSSTAPRSSRPRRPRYAKEASALYRAAEGGRADIAALLLERGAKPDWQNKAGVTPIFPACFRGHAETLRVLLERGADVDHRDGDGETALLCLAKLKNPQAVCQTPLIWAASNSNLGLVKALLAEYPGKVAAAADVLARTNRGRNVLHIAAETNAVDVVRYLLSAVRTPLHQRGRLDPAPQCRPKGHAEIVGLLIEAKSRVNAQLSNGMTALHWAAAAGHEDVVCRILDDPHADVMIKDNLSRTPMLCAAQEAISILRGAWPLIISPKGFPQRTFKEPVYKVLYDHVPILPRNIDWIETLLAKAFIEGNFEDFEGFKALQRCFDQEHRGYFSHAHFMRTYCTRVSAPKAEGPECAPNLTKSPLVVVSEEAPATAPGSDGEGDAPPQRPSLSPMPGTPEPPRRRRSGRCGIPRELCFYAFPPLRVLRPPARHGRHHPPLQKRSPPTRAPNAGPDHYLIQAYINHVPPLHPRRTLDQYLYYGIDTTARDSDQVVYRHCLRERQNPKVFMVDQLWLFILGSDLVITCFPQRWNQTKDDHLKVLEGVIEDTNIKTRSPIASVYDLAMVIVHRTSGMFGRHLMCEPHFQFLDMFDSSIGHPFNDSAASSITGGGDGDGDSMEGNDIEVSDTLLDIGLETKLLAEVKDIRDELGIITSVLEAQMAKIPEFEQIIIEELQTENVPRSVENIVMDIKKRSREMTRLVSISLTDIKDRMDKQAERIYNSLTHLLDLKQKHSNALEARFARDQAVTAGRQGQTIMVFTILSVGYVSKYMFGIGLAISLPLIVLAFTIDNIHGLLRRFILGALHGVQKTLAPLARPSHDGMFIRRAGGDMGYSTWEALGSRARSGSYTAAEYQDLAAARLSPVLARWRGGSRRSASSGGNTGVGYDLDHAVGFGADGDGGNGRPGSAVKYY
ncbi:unnamed protein product [Parascedosporium putredinis]|uniref:Ankyrin n=1 Tax=Parascedosporium putredinis TaxID=1442378 RepID=A0A9P1H540_9PEZI|nr:unnamed protein product [Parascedosporium putredinis]CAI7996189.1 unnamed protein product [Parascedosporium putredinis]